MHLSVTEAADVHFAEAFLTSEVMHSLNKAESQPKDACSVSCVFGKS